uniref:Diacylglycerol kinase accessory domain-containing protein n=1 Tax=Arundo donax TaxID=35708 RepID=A0A0A9HG19_ARUDO
MVLLRLLASVTLGTGWSCWLLMDMALALRRYELLLPLRPVGHHTSPERKPKMKQVSPSETDITILLAHGIRFEFHKGAADHTFMRVDGEPWKQPLLKDDDAVVVEISHLGQVTMLANEPCRSRSVNDPSSPSQAHDSHGDDNLEDEEWEDGKRKFGAADTFKIPDEIDIAYLS